VRYPHFLRWAYRITALSLNQVVIPSKKVFGQFWRVIFGLRSQPIDSYNGAYNYFQKDMEIVLVCVVLTIIARKMWNSFWYVYGIPQLGALPSL